MEQGLSCPGACGVFLDQGLNPVFCLVLSAGICKGFPSGICPPEPQCFVASHSEVGGSLSTHGVRLKG